MRAALLLALGLALPAAAQDRVISVGGGVTEIAWALGAGSRVVAVDTTSTHPAAAMRLPNVGYLRSLSAEGVLSLRPQVVLASSDAGPPPALAQIRAAGVKIVTLPNSHSFESLVGNVRATASALGTGAEGERLVSTLAADWEKTRAWVAMQPSKPRVLFLLAHGGAGAMQAGGADTGADAMIRYAGAINVAEGFKGYKPLSAEAALGMAPDAVLITDEGLRAIGGADALWKHASLALTPAGKARRVVSVGALYLLGFGPRMPGAVRELAERLRAG